MSIDFAGVTAVTIPEGTVEKIVRKSDGVILWEKPTAIGNLAVGSSVYMNVNGVLTEFIIIHQGLPWYIDPNLDMTGYSDDGIVPMYDIPGLREPYDSSCDGTWLLMKKIYIRRYYGDNKNGYKSSEMNTYLNSTFLNLFDDGVKNLIKQVKIPYTDGSGTTGVVQEQSSGLSTKIFLLSGAEVGFRSSTYCNDEGCELDYFDGVGDAKRIAYFNESTLGWWLRSPAKGMNDMMCYINTEGSPTAAFSVISMAQLGVRPALIMPSDTYVDNNNAIIA